MYQIGEQDKVRELTDAPRPDAGAPLPVVFASDNTLCLIYLISDPDPSWDGTTVELVSHETSKSKVALVHFEFARAHMFGPPNDEAFEGHPLASRGLEPYSAWEVENSSWIRRLERMNAVHPLHHPQQYDDYRHFIFAFHDNTFECIAERFDCWVTEGSVKSVLETCLSKWS